MISADSNSRGTGRTIDVCGIRPASAGLFCGVSRLLEGKVPREKFLKHLVAVDPSSKLRAEEESPAEFSLDEDNFGRWRRHPAESSGQFNRPFSCSAL